MTNERRFKYNKHQTSLDPDKNYDEDTEELIENEDNKQ